MVKGVAPSVHGDLHRLNIERLCYAVLGRSAHVDVSVVRIDVPPSMRATAADDYAATDYGRR